MRRFASDQHLPQLLLQSQDFPPRVIWLRRSVRTQAVKSSTRRFTDQLQKKKVRLGRREAHQPNLFY